MNAETILETLARFECSPGTLGKILGQFRREGPYVGRPFSRQAVWNWAHPESSGWYDISAPFQLAMRRLLNGDGDLRDAIELSWPDLGPAENVPKHTAVRGRLRRCACGCGRPLYAGQHRYINDEHKSAARNKRRRNGR